jgi:rod shape-determining protein MreC
VSAVFIFTSQLGVLSPLENILSLPLQWVTGLMTDTSIAVINQSNAPQDIEALRQRNAELEEQLALIQGEVIQLREIASDYQRLANLLEYTSNRDDQEFITADVIGVDQQSSVRSLFINKGTRDGVAVGMPVVTQLGLVGRVFNVSANTAQIQLISDQNSSVSARLQTTRAEGSVQGRGLLTGNLRMTFIPLDAEIIEGDLVVTSGLGGNFPPDIVLGQVTSIRSFEFELFQEAEVRSLIDFTTLEFVLVVTNFEPADLSVFDDPET